VDNGGIEVEDESVEDESDVCNSQWHLGPLTKARA